MRVVLAVARSKFRQRQHFLTQFTDMLFYYCYKCFYNILINHYIVCVIGIYIETSCTAVVGRTVGIICESVTDSLSRLTRDYPSTFFLVYIFKCVITSMNYDHHFCICFMHMYNC